jgi:vacuolar-type H+-ATPase subunit I/STV1
MILLIHNTAFKSRFSVIMNKLLESLGSQSVSASRMGQDIYPDTATFISGEKAGFYQEALAVAHRIKSELKKLDPREYPFTKDVAPMLDSYLQQVHNLEEKSGELDGIIGNFSSEAEDREYTRLSEKITKTDNRKLKREYEKRIQEIEKRHSSLQELKDEQEIARIRCVSAVDTLKNLHLDLVRIRNIGTEGGKAAISSLKDKAEELSLFIRDVQSSLEDLEELEEK